MYIQLEFIDFIVPIKTIKTKHLGGWGNCVSDHANLIGGRVCYNENLFRDGAMSPTDIDLLIDAWQELGF